MLLRKVFCSDSFRRFLNLYRLKRLANSGKTYPQKRLKLAKGPKPRVLFYVLIPLWRGELVFIL